MKGELLRRLFEGDPEERRIAAEDLVEYGDEETIRALFRAMVTDKNRGVKEACAESLKQIGGELVMREAANLLNGPDPLARALCLEILASFGEKAIPLLMPLLKSPDYNDRKYALDALALIGGKRAMDLILGMTGDPEPNVKYTAVEYLSPMPPDSKITEALKGLLEGAEDEYGISTICQVVRSRREKELLPVLLKKVKGVEDPFIKHWLYKAIVVLDGEEHIKEALENALRIDAVEDVLKDIILAKGEIPEGVKSFIRDKGIKVKDQLLEEAL
ncbi:MAG: hypothetical protein DRG31_02265 [Deltaproteobacteria bacterium]|nr:MAG: hypothetical protein DRG31_02265 [Deltaproteobacteria bacterium]